MIRPVLINHRIQNAILKLKELDIETDDAGGSVNIYYSYLYNSSIALMNNPYFNVRSIISSSSSYIIFAMI